MSSHIQAATTQVTASNYAIAHVKKQCFQTLHAYASEYSYHGMVTTTNLGRFLQFHKYLLNYYHIFSFLKNCVCELGKNCASMPHIHPEAPPQLQHTWDGKGCAKPGPNNPVWHQGRL